ncbi:hypothetical protein K701_09215 [Streptomyces fradiae ATCC 10745 = DSM 40063]|uniref:Uncharacterized protein n=1 Tax=Streptomyces fradiae ATCC 10745 = DSM 40063 TaxID=1319510 RepID=A0ABQ6XX63_STRFR|nr:hypothetical protein K701_09215 [Streptomyces fradiae ATCC 10745 = DSM 40063]QEV12382.1 hypothetical protein CP974_10465 [Streptomyces fradiae ATCC 10745 = DSM 40063]
MHTTAGAATYPSIIPYARDAAPIARRRRVAAWRRPARVLPHGVRHAVPCAIRPAVRHAVRHAVPYAVRHAVRHARGAVRWRAGGPFPPRLSVADARLPR